MAGKSSSARKKGAAPKKKSHTSVQRGTTSWLKQWTNLRDEVSETFDRERGRFIFGLILFISTLFVFLSSFSYLFTASEDQSLVLNAPSSAEMHTYRNVGRAFGAHIGEFAINNFLGLGTFFLYLFLFIFSFRSLGIFKKASLIKWFVFCVGMALWGALAASLIDSRLGVDLCYRLGGAYGDLWYDFLNTYIGIVGIFLSVLLFLLIMIVIVYRESMHKMRAVMQMDWRRSPSRKSQQEDLEEDEESEDEEEEPLEEEPKNPIVEQPQITDLPKKKEVEILKESIQEKKETAPRTLTREEELPREPKPAMPPAMQPQREMPTLKSVESSGFEVVVAQGDDDSQSDFSPRRVDSKENHYEGAYRFPSIDFLEDYGSNDAEIDMQEIEDKKRIILQALESFNIRTTPKKVTIGPSVTLFEVVPDAGIKISRIRNLEDELALSIKSPGGIRIIGPLQGGTVGIEVPNKSPMTVSMRSVIDSKKFRNTTFQLPVAIGRTITNDVYVFDLAKMPHLLIAGATGQGKSVGLNAMITSLLYAKMPSELKFVLIDPKMLEFSIYESISKQYLASLPDEEKYIVTDMDKVVPTLNSICIEMDSRYQLLTSARVRNVAEYNEKIKSGELKPTDGHRFLPYIVVIIDEFADLIMTSGKEVERPIARIAQKARAAGIHMVIATQRPSADVITGVIKANFPARIAFKVFSAIDSRTILDSSGANQLVGRGDMLFFQGKEMERIQCAFIDTPETSRITAHIHAQPSALEPYRLPEAMVDADGKPKASLDANERDSLFEEVALMVVQSQQGSTSNIQRRFNIGYNRAGRIMDQLEAAGIVSSQDGSKPRQVLVSDERMLQNYL